MKIKRLKKDAMPLCCLDNVAIPLDCNNFSTITGHDVIPKQVSVASLSIFKFVVCTLLDTEN
jgi:hypothetical protein